MTALAGSQQPFVPEVFVGGGGSGGSMDALFATLTGLLRRGGLAGALAADNGGKAEGGGVGAPGDKVGEVPDA